MKLFGFRVDPVARALRQCRLVLHTSPIGTVPGAPVGLAVEVHNRSSRHLPGRRDLKSRLLTLGARMKRVGDSSWEEVPNRGILDTDLPPGGSMVVGLRMDAPPVGQYLLLLSLVLEGVTWQADIAPSSTVETTLLVDPPASARVLNLGSGTRPLDGAVNLDRALVTGVDVQADLEDLPWPFADGEFAEVLAFDVFEHVGDPLAFMTEAHRILRAGGMLKIHTSYWRTEGSFTDPTHRRFCTPNTFDYWVPGTPRQQRYPHYSAGHPFAKRVVAIDGEELYFKLQKLSV